MGSRRRNVFILLLVLGLLVASLAVIASKRTVLGLDLRGGTQLVYQGRPTPQTPVVTPDAIDRAIEIIRKRTDTLGVSEPEIQRIGSDQIQVGLPDVQNAKEAQDRIGQTSQLYFYDFEANVIPPPTRARHRTPPRRRTRARRPPTPSRSSSTRSSSRRSGSRSAPRSSARPPAPRTTSSTRTRTSS